MPNDSRDGHAQTLIETYRYLAGHPEVFRAIDAGEADPLRVQKELRERFPDAAVRLALTVAELRRKAAGRGFPDADRMWFDRVRLEQATAWPVAQHKAGRFSGEKATGERAAGVIHDLCCGAGGDALALAERHNVVAVDADPLACLLTELNAEQHGVRERIDVRCAAVQDFTSRDGLLHIDPDRRAGASGRAVRVEDYVPSIEVLRQLAREYAGGAIKLSPASNFGGKFEDVEIELVSLDGECKEATIWFGTLAGTSPWRATALPSEETITGDPLSEEPRLGPLGAYIYDPDPALVRGGLIDLFCAERGIDRLDLAEEYLTADELVVNPFITPFRVLAELPNNERSLKRYLRERGAGVLEIKARRLRVAVERLQKTLPRTGDRPMAVLYCRIARKSRIVVAERV